MKKIGQSSLLLATTLFIGAITMSSIAEAQQSEEDELALSYGDKSSISIATGGQQSIARAPAVATVITAQDIEAMGATDLDQVLESVPGLHVSESSQGLGPIYSFRGIYTYFNPQVMMLVNGIPLTNVFTGNRSHVWGGMPLENVARIEVIRGPGSALYGADAYSGVINIITKTTADINTSQSGVRVGSFHSRDVWFQHANNLGPFAVAFYLRAGHTDGSQGSIPQDLQSSLDKIFHTNTSRAPGQINAMRNALDSRADISYDKWRFRAAYQQRQIGTGTGLADNLDLNTQVPGSRLYLDVTYQNTNWLPHWDVSSVMGYYDIKDKPAEPAYELFPPGAFNGTFPNGVIGNPGHSERHSHASISAFYTGLDKHRIRIGSGVRIEDLYEVHEAKNFNFVVIPGVGPFPVPLPGLVDATGNPSLVFLQPKKRHLAYIFVQDEWSIAKDWTLTAGLRQDHYSDFGTTTNPRAALVWDAAYNVVIKALHGRAFRAPSFVEQYAINNPVTLGNPNLKPETITTNELSFSWQPITDIQTNLTLFQYHMRDIIRFVANTDPITGATARNAGDQKGRGLEWEASWDASRMLRITGNFSLQHSIDEASGKDAGLAPQKRLFARADWRFIPLWQLGATFNHVADRTRQPGDNRPKIADYNTLDLNLRREKLAGHWEISAMVRNLFNHDAREPTFAPGNIPFDLPLAGRTIFVQIQHSL